MATSDRLRTVPLSDLVITGDRRLDQRLDDALIRSIRAHGLLQPIVVQPDGLGRYEVLAGRRRLRHAKAAGVTEVPVLVRGTSDALERLMVEAEENAHRRDWTPIELGDLCRELTQVHRWTQGQVADWLSGLLGRHVSQSQVSQYVKLLEMTDAAKAAVASGRLSFSLAREISRLNDTPELQRLLVADLEGDTEADLSVRAIRRRVDRLLQPAELHAEEIQEAGARAAERVYGTVASCQFSVASSEAEGEAEGEAEAEGEGEAATGDPLVGLYLDQVREGLAYLTEHRLPAAAVAMAREVVALAETLRGQIAQRPER